MPPSRDATTRLRVLLVDDEPLVLSALHRTLSHAGFDVLAVGGSVEAQRLLNTEPVDVLVTDLAMPDLDGFALIEAARTLNPTLPVVIVTALAIPSHAERAHTLGVQALLRKPFLSDELVRAVYGAVGIEPP